MARRSPSSEAFRGGRAAKIRTELLRQLPAHCPLDGTLMIHAEDVEVDHITPISMGGAPYARSNVRLICKACNRKRGNGNGTITPATIATTRRATVAPDPRWSICWFHTDACGTSACRCGGRCWPHCGDPDCASVRGCSRAKAGPA